jgi:hypothetical protein
MIDFKEIFLFILNLSTALPTAALTPRRRDYPHSGGGSAAIIVLTFTHESASRRWSPRRNLSTGGG